MMAQAGNPRCHGPCRKRSAPAPVRKRIDWFALADGIAKATPQALTLFHEIIDAVVVMEQEQTKREEIAVMRETSLEAIRAGTEEAQKIIDKEYAERADFQEKQTVLMKILIEQGNGELALQLGKMILERSADRQILHDLITYRNSRASVSMIHLRVVEPEP